MNNIEQNNLNSAKHYIKIFYFLIYACMGIYGPFISIYYSKIGISEENIGLFLSISTAVSFFSASFWGYISDKKKNRNEVLLICVSGNIAAILLFLLSANFYYVFFVTTLTAFFFKPLLPLTDSAALEIARYDQSHFSYGKIRVWGTIGFLFANFVLGWFIEKTGLKTLFIAYAIMMLIAFLIPLIISQTKIDIEPHKTELKNLLFFLKKHFLIIFIACILIEISNTVIYGFYGLYLQSLGFTNQQIGIAWGIGVIVEIPLMMYFHKFIKTFGLKKWLIFGLIAHLIKYLSLSQINSVEYFYIILLVQITHGIFFGAFYASLVNLIDLYTPKNLKNSGQSLLFATTYSAGAIIGFSLNGYILKIFGFPQLFLTNAGLLSVGIILFFLLNFQRGYINEK
ncbi:MAG TPA: MFS transporter [bacterium]|nr:MFS transporter [bacterium]